MRRTNRGDWNLVRKVIYQSRIKWTLGSFRPFKSAGTDGIIPALLHRGVGYLASQLCLLFRACVAYGYIPKTWSQTMVFFIPKLGRASYTEAKAYSPESLSDQTPAKQRQYIVMIA
jgi:hypothetical protein